MQAHGELCVVIAGHKVPGHQPDALCTIRFRSSLAFAYEIVHARCVPQVAHALVSPSSFPFGERESELTRRRNACFQKFSAPLLRICEENV